MNEHVGSIKWTQPSKESRSQRFLRNVKQIQEFSHSVSFSRQITGEFKSLACPIRASHSLQRNIDVERLSHEKSMLAVNSKTIPILQTIYVHHLFINLIIPFLHLHTHIIPNKITISDSTSFLSMYFPPPFSFLNN